MVKTIELMCFIAFIAFTQSCKQIGPMDPEEVGRQAFQIAIGLDTITIEEYRAHLITIPEIRIIGENMHMKIDDDIRKRLTSMTVPDWFKNTEKDYNSIINYQDRWNIKWSTIQYVDFSYKQSKFDDFKLLTGDLYFNIYNESNGRTYLGNLQVKAIWDGSRYRIETLRKSKK
ncbi:MAG TPA: hypothetical protein PKD45_15345 [Flavobacteriales bacterium]|nr:hypothetical protein [Flavobacteriales bacterium]